MMREIDCPGVIALVDDPDSALAWWRIVAPFTRLRQLHVPARWSLLSESTMKLHPADVVLLPRLFPIDTPDGQAVMLANTIEPIRQHAAALVYDMDDDLVSDDYIRHHILTDWGDGNGYEEMRRRCDNTLWTMSQCDAVTAASEPLAAYLRTLVDVPVYTVPNAIDVRWYRSRLAARSLWAGRVTIGWAGGRRPPGDFTTMTEAWGRVARRHPEVLFVVCGDPTARRFAAAQVPEHQVNHIEWAHIQDMPMVSQVDIGCCAVEDEPFNIRKTPIKAWEYALGGAAVVATPTLYSPDVADGFTGRLATTVEEWEEALEQLLADEEQRRFLAANLATRVEQLHSLDRELWRWTDAWGRAVESRQHRASEVAA